MYVSQYIKNLIDNQSLTVTQYNTFLDYLREKREQQLKIEIGDEQVFKMRDINAERAKLQDQIYEILTRKTINLGRNGKLNEFERKTLFEKMRKDAGIVRAMKSLKSEIKIKKNGDDLVAGSSKSFCV